MVLLLQDVLEFFEAPLGVDEVADIVSVFEILVELPLMSLLTSLPFLVLLGSRREISSDFTSAYFL